MAKAVPDIPDFFECAMFFAHIIRQHSKKAFNRGKTAAPVSFCTFFKVIFDIGTRAGTMFQHVGAIDGLAWSTY